MDGHLSDILRLLKNGQKSDSFSDHFEQYFNFTKYPTYLYKYIKFKVLKQQNPNDLMKNLQHPTATYVCRNIYQS